MPYIDDDNIDNSMKGLTMTRNGRKTNRKRVIATFLTGMMVVQQASMMGAFAAITAGGGVGAGIDPIGSNGYILTPGKTAGGNGFSHYTDFNLGSGQYANLDFSSIPTGAFYNLVDQQIVINGILTSIKNGNFHNGNAVFISPKGMVVGASGVINVGSLGVYTPAANIYDAYKNNAAESININTLTADYSNGGAPIRIDAGGKIFTQENVNLQGGNINIANGAGVFAGVNNNKLVQLKNGTISADTLFNNLVNASNVVSGSEFANANGSITIKSNQEALAGGVNIAGNVRNLGAGDTYIYNNTHGGMTISGNVTNANGNLEIVSDQSGLTITETGRIRNNGTTRIANEPVYEGAYSKTLNGETLNYNRDINSGLNIQGNIDTTGTLTIYNTGTEGMNISGNINHEGALSIKNSAAGDTLNSSFGTASTEDEVNARMKALNITGKVINKKGNTTITNNGAGGLKASGIDNQNGNLTMLNTGAGGLTTSGTIKNNGIATVDNEAGAMTIGGSFTNTGKADFHNKTGATNFAVNGNVTNSNGKLTMTNDGSGAFTTGVGSHINAKGIEMVNNTGSEFTMNGELINVGQADLINKKGNFTVAGTVNNTGVGNFTNSGANLAINGNVTNSNGKLTIRNNGTGALTTGTNSHINAKGIEMVNNTGSGFSMSGELINVGQADLTNKKGYFTISGTIDNTGTGNYTNESGAGDFSIYTTKFDNKGNGNYINKGDDFVLNGNMSNTQGNASYQNLGTGKMTFSGTIVNDGTTTVINSNNSGKLTVGGNFTNTGLTTITNNSADGFDVTGIVTNNGNKLTLTNNNGAFNTKTGSSIDAKNNLDITNNGTGGLTTAGTIKNVGTANINNAGGHMTIGGTFTNTGNANFENKNGAMNFAVNGNITNSNGKLTMINNGSGALTTGTGSNINAKGIEMVNNTGSKFSMGGKLTNVGQADLTNKKGNFTITGSIDNTGTGNYTNESGAGDFSIYTTKFDNKGNGNYINKGDNFVLNGNMSNTQGDANYQNLGSGDMTFSGTIVNDGTTTVTNSNNSGKLTVGGNFTNTGLTTITNNSADGFDVTGTITNNDNKLALVNNNGAFNAKERSTIDTKAGLDITNNGAGGLTTAGTVRNVGTANINNAGGHMTIGGDFTNTGNANFENKNGAMNFTVTGDVTDSNGKLSMTNNGSGALTIAEDSKIIANNNLEMTNNGAGGLTVNGSVNSTGSAHITNTNGDLKVNGTITHKRGKLSLLNTNRNGGLYVYNSGRVENQDNNTLISNNGSKGLNIAGTVENGGVRDITNEGADAIRISGNVHSQGNITMNNTGNKGIKVTSTGVVQGDKDIHIINNVENSVEPVLPQYRSGGVSTENPAIGEIGGLTPGGGFVTPGGGLVNPVNPVDPGIIHTAENGSVNIQGQVSANGNVTIESTNANVTIGHKDTENNVMAGRNVNIKITDGNLLNNGVEKVLIKAGGDLTMDVTNGTIGSAVQQNGLTNSTGIGPKADGSRDFTKSINANVAGKVKATTKDAAESGKDLVINYAAIASDMNIDSIKADGRVILTVDDDYGANNTGKRYNMVNASTDPNNVNVEGWGISLISNGSIGSKDNMLTFVQTDAANHKMDALANENIYLKENSFNAYGRDKETTQNSVSTMIAREGDMYVEFAGDTTIDNITAEGDMTVITRGKNLSIENLGHIQDDKVTPADYFGPRHNGYIFDGRYNGDEKADVLPNNVTLKALDINHNIRPTDELVDNGHEAWANSTVRVKNAVIDNGKMEITADNVYANGIYAGFNKDGFTKKEDNSTTKVKGVVDPASLNIPVGKAVRPGDVTGIGRDEKERNYYYPAGDGDIEINKIPSTVDPDDNIVDATPLEIVKGGGDNPIIPPGPGPGPGPDNPDVVPDDQDGKMTWKKVDDTDVEAIDKRQYMRFGIATNEHPVLMEKTNNGIDELLDVSRGGIAVTHSNKLKVGDVVPVHLTYADLDIKADVKVVTASSTRAGASFINLDKATANKLLYLNILLEGSNTLSFR